MRTKQGIITSAKMTGTVTVTVHRSVFHPMYKKRYRMSKKFLADSNGMELGVGDQVVITECRPISKRKCFKVTEVLKRAPRVSEMAEEKALEGAMQSKTKKTSDETKSPPNA
jgi:small subunit ribosomal protein S17